MAKKKTTAKAKPVATAAVEETLATNEMVEAKVEIKEQPKKDINILDNVLKDFSKDLKKYGHPVSPQKPSRKTLEEYEGWDTAVLHYKPHTSSVIPTVYAEAFASDAWLVYPWE